MGLTQSEIDRGEEDVMTAQTIELLEKKVKRLEAELLLANAAFCSRFNPEDCQRCALLRRHDGIPPKRDYEINPTCPQCGYWRDANAEAKENDSTAN